MSYEAIKGLTFDLKEHERMLLWRRRNRLTQARASAHFGLSRLYWGKCERGDGERKLDNSPECRRIRQTIRTVWDLYLHEKLLVLRERAGITQEVLAEELGCSKAWVQRQESGDIDPARLVAYWSARLPQESEK